jgi:hypothetical protein
MTNMPQFPAQKENKSQAWYHILKAVQVEAREHGQDFLAYLICIAMAHLASVRATTDLDHENRS